MINLKEQINNKKQPINNNSTTIQQPECNNSLKVISNILQELTINNRISY